MENHHNHLLLIHPLYSVQEGDGTEKMLLEKRNRGGGKDCGDHHTRSLCFTHVGIRDVLCHELTRVLEREHPSFDALD